MVHVWMQSQQVQSIVGAGDEDGTPVGALVGALVGAGDEDGTPVGALVGALVGVGDLVDLGPS